MEFGSDFNLIAGYKGEPKEIERLNPVYFADGRMGLQYVFKIGGYERLWVPRYFCHEVLRSLENGGISLRFYNDFPEADDDKIIRQIPFEKDDALLRMNYFGLRDVRDSSHVGVDVIEDHTHGLLTNWAQNSNANFCVASLRKSMPLPEGGIAWSRSNISITPPDSSTQKNEVLVSDRLLAMKLKGQYLQGEDVDKEEFRRLYQQTEEAFNSLPICDMSPQCKNLYQNFDQARFEAQKKKNWLNLTSLLARDVEFLKPENAGDTPFSLILRFQRKGRMEAIRAMLISKCVYPAVLWSIPDEDSLGWPFYLSVHCDGRYDDRDIEKLSQIINEAYRH